MEHFISGFQTRVDKISHLNLGNNLKVHLMPVQADIEYHENQVVIGAMSRSYDVHHINYALRNIYPNRNPTSVCDLAQEMILERSVGVKASALVVLTVGEMEQVVVKAPARPFILTFGIL